MKECLSIFTTDKQKKMIEASSVDMTNVNDIGELYKMYIV